MLHIIVLHDTYLYLLNIDYPSYFGSTLHGLGDTRGSPELQLLSMTKGLTHTLSRPNLFQLISIDFIGPRRVFATNFYVMIIVDHHSRYMITTILDIITNPLPQEDIRDHWISKFGVPITILADRDPVFISKSFQYYITVFLGCKLHYTSVEYPQGNGINESSHRILETAIKSTAWKIDTKVKDVIADCFIWFQL